MLSIKNLTKTYEDAAVVDDVTIDLPPGKVISLIGPNGAGKSTVLGMISRLIARTAGIVEFKGRDITHWESRELAKHLAILTQANFVQMKLTVRELVAFGRFPHSGSALSADDWTKVDQAIHYMELEAFADRFIDEMSGGQRQRIGIARALAVQPEFIVLDEPISALDVSIRAQVLNLLKKFQREKQVTYLFIAHDLSIVRFISDRIGVIYKGNIVEVADAEELFNFPLHPYTHSLISAIPIPDPQLEKNKVLYTYDPSIHDYSVDKPEFVDIGHNHFVYGNKKEIEEYKALREKGEPLQPITIRKPGEEVKEEDHEVHFSKAEDEFLKTPLHDTGSIWYKVLSFFFPIIGIIAAMVYKKKQYYHNYKACKQGALYGFAVLAVILLIFIIALILVVL